MRRHWRALLAGAVVLVVVLVIGVPWVYIHFIEGNQPAALNLGSAPSASASASAAGRPVADINGNWTVTSGSQAGYRVHETLAGQAAVAVGRTNSVTGSLTLSGAKVTAATFTVRMATVTSDRPERDQQFTGRIMDTSQYPAGTFTLTRPIDLGAVPALGAAITARASGNLTLHGTTRPVTFTATAKRTASNIDVTGDITIAYGDYNIANPSFGGFVSVGNSGTIEFLLVFAKS